MRNGIWLYFHWPWNLALWDWEAQIKKKEIGFWTKYRLGNGIYVPLSGPSLKAVERII